MPAQLGHVFQSRCDHRKSDGYHSIHAVQKKQLNQIQRAARMCTAILNPVRQILHIVSETVQHGGVTKRAHGNVRDSVALPHGFALLSGHGLANMIYALGLTQSPKVALALSKLSRDGKAVKFRPDYELYLAFWLQGYGVEDPLIDAVTHGSFELAVRARIAEKAEQKNSTYIPMFPD